ncbi:28S ribosomal protein S5, mitochondrial [Lamellibrachia satsuma]|nr:28S ribosomal protein S5, mitochondrial [Lamellibrachia satsuma]
MAAAWRAGVLILTKSPRIITSCSAEWQQTRHQCSLVNQQLQYRLCLRMHTMSRQSSVQMLQPPSVITTIMRDTTYFTKVGADQLWEGVVAVSNAGRKRGRGKRVGRKKITDLNRGQMIGTGKANILWPGLNTPVLKGRQVIQLKQLPPNPDRDAELVRIRDEMSRISYKANPPLLRGWSGSRFPGQSMGPPDAVGDYKFEGFDTKVLEFRLVTNMTGTLGRKQRFTAFVVVGNKNGLAGYGLGKSQNGRAAIRVAKNRAAQNLMFIPRFQSHTVFHNMYTKYHKTSIFVHKKQKGYGLVCHRAIRTICEMMGIQDLHAKVEGSSKNVKAVTKGFFNALIHQETHQDLADRMGLHVVETSELRADLPVVVASPADGIVRDEQLIDEAEDLEMDYDRLYFGGKVEYKKPKKLPFYHKLRSYRYRKAEDYMRRNQAGCKVLRDAGLW